MVISSRKFCGNKLAAAKLCADCIIRIKHVQGDGSEIVLHEIVSKIIVDNSIIIYNICYLLCKPLKINWLIIST